MSRVRAHDDLLTSFRQRGFRDRRPGRSTLVVGLFLAVARGNRNVLHTDVEDIQVNEHVIFEKIPPRKMVEVQVIQGFRLDRE